MLTFDDCLGLSGLTPEQVAALARHEHLPEIVALEMGWSLCGTTEGRRRIRRMILDDIEDACRHGDPRAAARLGLALHHFLEAHQDRRVDDAQDVPAATHDGSDRPARALHLDPAAALWVRERLNTYLAAMLRQLGLDRAAVRERFPEEMRAMEMCCAACTETGRCRRFLAGMAGAEPPSAFCPNAVLLERLGQGGLPSREDR